jgi:hypothetical protein
VTDDAAFSGLAGDVVRTLAPHTEADATGLLVTFLAAFGAAVGPGPHSVADGSIHPARLNVVLVGRSARARKGTSWAVIRRVFEHAHPAFCSGRVIGGLTSGEGLVADLANRPEGPQRHVLVMEPEFARLLRVSARSATLSALIRQAWDGGDLAILTRKQPLRATNASVSILGHVTAEELRRRLDQTEIANGLANRFLFAWVERSKRLPNGGRLPIDELESLGIRVRDAINRARQLGLLTRSPQAEARWAAIYHGLDDNVDGVVGSLTARAEAQMLRISVTYALLDGSSMIEVAHVDAAEAVWQHCEATINRVFGDRQPDWVLPRLLAALKDAGAEGLDGSAQRDLFHRHLSGVRLAAARAELHARGLARTIAIDTGGRPRIVTKLVNAAEPIKSSESEAVWSLSSLSRSPVSSLERASELGLFLGSDNRKVSGVSSDD